MRKFIPRITIRLLVLIAVILLLQSLDTALDGIPLTLDDSVRGSIRFAVLTLVWVCAGTVVNAVFELIAYDFMAAAALGTSVPGIIRIFSRIVFYLFLAALIVHFVYDKSVVAFLTALGAGGVVIGLAARQLMSDVMNGLALNVDRPFRIGDWISMNVPGAGLVDGQVIEIGWRTTTIRAVSNWEWIIPNHQFGEGVVRNYSRPEGPITISVDIVIDFDTPTERVQRILTNAAVSVRNEPGFDPAWSPRVVVGEVEGRGVKYSVLTRFTPFADGGPIFRAKSALMDAVLAHIRNSGISPALDKQDIFIARQQNRQLSTRREEDVALIVFRMALFELLARDEILDMIRKSERLEYLTGETMVEQGEQGDSMFVVLEGLLDVFLKGEDGNETKVRRIGPGQFFGEMSLLTGDARSATVRAATSGVSYEISKSAMTGVLEARPELLESISRVVAERRASVLQAQAGNQQEAVRGFTSQLASRMRSFFAIRG